MRNQLRPQSSSRRFALPLAALLVALLAALMAGCGSSADPGAGPSSGVPSEPPSTTLPAPSATPSSSATMSHGPGPGDPSVPPAEDAAQLNIIYSADGTTKQTWTLTCAPNGGTHPDPAAACAALATAGTAPFDGSIAGQQCTQQYGGPQTASVRGTVRGETVSGTFSRTNGCQISRWSQLEGLLPAV